MVTKQICLAYSTCPRNFDEWQSCWQSVVGIRNEVIAPLRHIHFSCSDLAFFLPWPPCFPPSQNPNLKYGYSMTLVSVVPACISVHMHMCTGALAHSRTSALLCVVRREHYYYGCNQHAYLSIFEFSVWLVIAAMWMRVSWILIWAFAIPLCICRWKWKAPLQKQWKK